jgi:hypothetical protein
MRQTVQPRDDCDKLLAHRTTICGIVNHAHDPWRRDAARQNGAKDRSSLLHTYRRNIIVTTRAANVERHGLAAAFDLGIPSRLPARMRLRRSTRPKLAPNRAKTLRSISQASTIG